ncbi:MAG: hypothetical protein WD826_03310, partial [Actinomycetota bacterium]
MPTFVLDTPIRDVFESAGSCDTHARRIVGAAMDHETIREATLGQRADGFADIAATKMGGMTPIPELDAALQIRNDAHASDEGGGAETQQRVREPLARIELLHSVPKPRNKITRQFSGDVRHPRAHPV